MATGTVKFLSSSTQPKVSGVAADPTHTTRFAASIELQCDSAEVVRSPRVSATPSPVGAVAYVESPPLIPRTITRFTGGHYSMASGEGRFFVAG